MSKPAVETTRFEEVIGHPPGLFVLFFAEMWERFSYYGMRALLIFYMIKGFMGASDERAYGIYGAYGALVYATPFIGGMIADRLLGARRTVVIGGVLMAIGHLLMTVENQTAFFTALALLICGNGFFKPNISTIVGSLYAEGSHKRDSGFTLFYMGINLGAAMSPLLCGYIGETYGWHYGFGLATVGMLVGLAVFVAPRSVTQGVILLGALSATGTMVWSAWEDKLMLAVNVPIALALLVAAGIAVVALREDALPAWAGQAPDPEALERPLIAGLKPMQAVIAGTIVAVPVFALLVQRNAVAGYVLSLFGLVALGSLVVEAIRSAKIERERMVVVLILMFFSMLFWAFFEQAGSSVNNFTDRNVDRVFEERVITQADVGQTLPITLDQEQLGYRYQGEVLNLTRIEALQKDGHGTVQWTIAPEDVGMGVGGSSLKASIFQAANPTYILIFGLVFSMAWTALGERDMEPSTPVKFGLGLLQLGLGFGALWYGAEHADARGMVGIGWLLLGYLLHTTGELCLSPVGLAMVTRLSPKRLVATVMGAWFLATAFSNYLAAIIAKLTGVTHGADGENIIPPPIDTVHVYGDVFGKIALAAMASAVIVFVIAPLLKRWMHEDVIKPQ